MTRAITRLVLLAAVALASCSQRDRQAEPKVTHTSLPDGVVARVGDVDVTADLVGAVAAARKISPRDATDLLVDDALAAHGARVRHLDATAIIARDLVAVRARTTLVHVRDESRAKPPDADELEEFSGVRWREVAMGEQLHVVHAVVMRPSGSTGPDPEGSAIAEQIQHAVASAANAAEFEASARAVPRAGREVRVEDLSFVEDGRMTVGPEANVAAPFVAASLALSKPGATSPIVETSFGWHVIRLIERLPGKLVAPADRSAYFAEDIYAARARRALSSVLASARQRARTEITPIAEPLMAGLSAAAP